MTEKNVNTMNIGDVLTETEMLINKLDVVLQGLLDLYDSGDVSTDDVIKIGNATLDYRQNIKDLQAKLLEQGYYHLLEVE
jgi:hypothetical protein